MDLMLAAETGGWGEQLLSWFTALLGLQSDSAVAILKIIGINIVLSGDNAIVIALACRSLPPRQRIVGIALGAGAAIILRIIFTILVQQLLGVPYLKLIGGLLLLWISVKLLLSEEAHEDSIKGGSTLWEAVRIVAVADVVMSLDNVLAIAAAAGGDQTLIILGLIISIPLVVFGSTLVMGLLTRFPILVWAGAALLGWIAGELIAREPILHDAMTNLAAMSHLSMLVLTRTFEVAGAAFVILLGWYLKQRTAEPTLKA
jgi:YjbE family integral membrane protein